MTPHLRSANIPPAARREPKKALRPTSIHAPFAQTGFPATSATKAPVASAAA